MSDRNDDLERLLAALGQGYTWHLDEHPTWQAAVTAVRRAAAADGYAPGDSPLVPEGAVATAGRLSAQLPAGARVLVLDADPRLVDALSALGYEVAAIASPAREALWAGARARHPASEILDLGLHEVAPAAHQRAFDAALVDTHHFAEQWTPLLAQALWSVKVGGRVGVLLHPQQREHARRMLPRLPAQRVARHDESCGRLVATAGALGDGLVLSDYPSDCWVLEVEEGAPPLDPARPWRAEALDEHDPTYARHGIMEVHDVREDVEPDALARSLHLGLERAGLDISGEHGHDEPAFLHRFIALEGGGHVAATVQRNTGVVTCDVWRWTPALEVALASGFLDELRRHDRPVRLAVTAGG